MTAPAGVPSSRVYEEVTVGLALPGLSVALTRTGIVAAALASRDYQDVHHDPGSAVDRGMRDILMNIHTSNGLVDRYVTSWAGPAAVVTAIRIRLGVPNHPGDTMLLSGTVSATDDRNDRIEIALRGVNSLGTHITGTATMRLPRRHRS